MSYKFQILSADETRWVDCELRYATLAEVDQSVREFRRTYPLVRLIQI